jgi:hypothetical protein
VVSANALQQQIALEFPVMKKASRLRLLDQIANASMQPGPLRRSWIGPFEIYIHYHGRDDGVDLALTFPGACFVGVDNAHGGQP